MVGSLVFHGKTEGVVKGGQGAGCARIADEQKVHKNETKGGSVGGDGGSSRRFVRVLRRICKSPWVRLSRYPVSTS